ncbi:MAG: hypothetical protein KGQ37_04510 [Hyphomicrobiales bacterium]|nr:hypothetical protein [Hyphomicrobiales bacterium]
MPKVIEDAEFLDTMVTDNLPRQAEAGALAAHDSRAVTRWATMVQHAPSRLRRLWRPSPTALSFFAMVLIPTLVAALYTGILASDRYVSEFRVAIKSAQSTPVSGFASLLGYAGMTPTGNDSYAVVQYLQSRKAIETIEKTVPVQRLYADSQIDWFSRLPAKAPIETFTRYWRKMVTVTYEPSTGTITAHVSAFTPASARLIAATLMLQAETFINDMSARVQHDAVAFAQQRVDAAKTHLTKILDEARNLQNQYGLLDPRRTAGFTLAGAAKIKDQLTALKAQLAAQLTQLSPTSPSVTSTRVQIAALENQMRRLDAEATAPGAAPPGGQNGRQPLSDVLGRFQKLAEDQKFAEKSYAAALTALQGAQIEASKQQIYLATIVPPETPQLRAFPQPLKDISLTFAVALAVWLLTVMAVYAVREHA